MSALERTEGVALPDGGYLGIINVYHELHCIVSAGILPTVTWNCRQNCDIF